MTFDCEIYEQATRYVLPKFYKYHSSPSHKPTSQAKLVVFILYISLFIFFLYIDPF
ncbi:hypothetical protein MtrunA17_Chr2g0295101 [Medicago truncatula]|uniref:Transmembrane protein n=1 Tax=Medicago truncatula TaxID=3880 RepID=A0A396J947_MEDTR|nr:hypothetical protein MtrunA17_Chr2g0295101 [Medicago truncatula]